MVDKVQKINIELREQNNELMKKYQKERAKVSFDVEFGFEIKF